MGRDYKTQIGEDRYHEEQVTKSAYHAADEIANGEDVERAIDARKSLNIDIYNLNNSCNILNESVNSFDVNTVSEERINELDEIIEKHDLMQVFDDNLYI